MKTQKKKVARRKRENSGPVRSLSYFKSGSSSRKALKASRHKLQILRAHSFSVSLKAPLLRLLETVSGCFLMKSI